MLPLLCGGVVGVRTVNEPRRIVLSLSGWGGAAWMHPSLVGGCVCSFVCFVSAMPLCRGVVDVCDDLIVECSSWTQVVVFFVVCSRRPSPMGLRAGGLVVVKGAVVDALADSTDEGRVGPR